MQAARASETGTLGFPEALLLAMITAYRVGDRWQRCRGRQDGKCPLANALWVQYNIPWLKWLQEEGISPGPRVALCDISHFALGCVCSLCGKHVALCAWWGHSRENLGSSVCTEGKCFFLT